MKRNVNGYQLVLLAILFCICENVVAQDYLEAYEKVNSIHRSRDHVIGEGVNKRAFGFLEPDKNWTEVYSDNHGTRSYKYKFDTIPVMMMGNAYFKLLQSNTQFSNIWFPTSHLLREENNIIYEYSGNDERILYDFNLVEGDTFEVVNIFINRDLVVLSVDTIALLNGDLKKRWILDPVEPEDDSPVVWIEGIGNLNGLFTNDNSWSFDTPYSEVLCVYLSDNIIYDNPDIDSCWVMSTATKDVVEYDLILVPNPATDEIKIIGLEHGIESVKIFDAVGNQIYAGQKDHVSIAGWPVGYYFVFVQLKGYRIRTGGFVKN